MNVSSNEVCLGFDFSVIKQSSGTKVMQVGSNQKRENIREITDINELTRLIR